MKNLTTFGERWKHQLDVTIRRFVHDDSLKISQLAQEMHLSERTFRNYALEYLGATPSSYLLEKRLELAFRLWRDANEQISLAVVARKVGFRDAYHFSALFRQRYPGVAA